VGDSPEESKKQQKETEGKIEKSGDDK